GGNYVVSGLYDLKPSVVAQGLATNNLVHFSSDVGGGEKNIFQGVEVQSVARFSRGAFFQAGVSMQKRLVDQCNLLSDSNVVPSTFATLGVSYPDGTRTCHLEYPFRPDLKLLGSYTLPYDVLLSGTYQFTRGLQNGTAGGSSLTASWAAPNALFASALAPFRSPAVLSAAATTTTVA